jgi:hypothetical protein
MACCTVGRIVGNLVERAVFGRDFTDSAEDEEDDEVAELEDSVSLSESLSLELDELEEDEEGFSSADGFVVNAGGTVGSALFRLVTGSVTLLSWRLAGAIFSCTTS